LIGAVCWCWGCISKKVAPFSWRSRCNCSIRAEGPHIGLIGSAPNCLLVLCIDQPEGSGRYPRGVLGFTSVVDLEIGGVWTNWWEVTSKFELKGQLYLNTNITAVLLYALLGVFCLRQYSFVSTTSKTTECRTPPFSTSVIPHRQLSSFRRIMKT
jgi:hypothetical protein